MEQTGKTIFIIGLLTAALGLIIWLLGNKLSWFGNLPGDLKIERSNYKIYFPFASMLLLSVIVSLLLWLFNKIKS